MISTPGGAAIPAGRGAIPEEVGPIFADIELASRIERAECGILRDCAEAIRARRPDDGVRVVPIAGGMASYTAPGSPLNKIAGLGFAGPVDEAALVYPGRFMNARSETAKIREKPGSRAARARRRTRQDVEDAGREHARFCRRFVVAAVRS